MRLLLRPSERLTFFALPEPDKEATLPLMQSKVMAGFPSPASDFIEQQIDLNRHLIQHPAATFLARTKGLSMVNAGIDDGDLLVIDRSLPPQNNKIAVCFIDGEFTLKRLRLERDGCTLLPENDDFPPIKVDASNDFTIWGIVTHVIKTL